MKKRLPCSGIGGQAVLEGIMMRNKDKYAVAVRAADKEIDCRVGAHKDIAEKNVLARIPFVRGIFKLWDSMVLGIRALTYSSQFLDEEELEPDKFENWLTMQKYCVSGIRSTSFVITQIDKIRISNWIIH